jgi:endonuclease I
MYSETQLVLIPTTSINSYKMWHYSNEGDCYNREHIIPQSVQSASNGFDAHFITPTDGKVNGIRSNYPHSVVDPTTLKRK